MVFEELTTEEGFHEAFPVMRELRPRLDQDAFLALLEDMRPAGYRLFAARQNGAILALAGVAICTNLYDLRHIFVYDLVTRSDVRSQGVGRALLEHVEAFGQREGCGLIVLSSGFARTDAHRFYEERCGYERRSYIFRKSLTP